MAPKAEVNYGNYKEATIEGLASKEKIKELYRQAYEADTLEDSILYAKMASKLIDFRQRAQKLPNTDQLTDLVKEYEMEEEDISMRVELEETGKTPMFNLASDQEPVEEITITEKPVEGSLETTVFQNKEEVEIKSKPKRKERRLDIWKDNSEGEILNALVDTDEEGNFLFKTARHVGDQALKDNIKEISEKYKVTIYRKVKAVRDQFDKDFYDVYKNLNETRGYQVQTMGDLVNIVADRMDHNITDDPLDKVKDPLQLKAYKKIQEVFGEMHPEDFRSEIIWRGYPPKLRGNTEAEEGYN